MVFNDRRLTFLQTEKSMGISFGPVQTFLTVIVEMSNQSTRLVPGRLISDHKLKKVPG